MARLSNVLAATPKLYYHNIASAWLTTGASKLECEFCPKGHARSHWAHMVVISSGLRQIRENPTFDASLRPNDDSACGLVLLVIEFRHGFTERS